LETYIVGALVNNYSASELILVYRI
jgi:hypothetical protein